MKKTHWYFVVHVQTPKGLAVVSGHSESTDEFFPIGDVFAFATKKVPGGSNPLVTNQVQISEQSYLAYINAKRG